MLARVSDHADGRFAPSPTGPLHLGSLRTALVAWLFARSAGARFLVRVEDLDPQRSRRAFEAGQLADLRALGIDWDGPVVRQSERLERYREALATLDRDGRLYPCFCTRAEIREAASAPHGLPAGAYPGTCRLLSDDERATRISAGRPYALRVRAGGQPVGFSDRVLGERSAVVDDFVVRRADGVAAYQLAVVVDDAVMGMSDVVRGDDLLGSTARQLLLYRALNLPPPRFAHVPLILGPDGARLSKRHGAIGVRALADRGWSAARLIGLLASTLGLCPPNTNVMPPDLVATFTLDRITRAPTTLDPDAL
jgi:glutamyl-tRNA synthetase